MDHQISALYDLEAQYSMLPPSNASSRNTSAAPSAASSAAPSRNGTLKLKKDTNILDLPKTLKKNGSSASSSSDSIQPPTSGDSSRTATVRFIINEKTIVPPSPKIAERGELSPTTYCHDVFRQVQDVKRKCFLQQSEVNTGRNDVEEPAPRRFTV